MPIPVTGATPVPDADTVPDPDPVPDPDSAPVPDPDPAPPTVPAIALVAKVPGKFKSLENQVIRSASSVAVNVAEGAGRTGRDRIHYFRIAYASAKEVDVHLRRLSTW